MTPVEFALAEWKGKRERFVRDLERLLAEGAAQSAILTCRSKIKTCDDAIEDMEKPIAKGA